MGMFKLTCPHCSQKIEVEEEAKGQICNCPWCNQEIVICDDYAVGDADAPPKKDKVSFAPPPVDKKQAPITPLEPAEEKPFRIDPNTLLPPAFSATGTRLLCRISPLILAVLLCFLIVIILWPAKWEYKTVKISGESSGSYLSEKFNSIKLDEEGLARELNLSYGSWELVSAVNEIETVYPNFGKEDYHTGIKPNTRSKSVILIFRRRKIF